ncbi:hypothetical protein F4861DRAFT_538138, partial [Xylaria intraflava]
MSKPTTIVFNSPDDFPLWEEDFVAGARSRDIWEFLSPGEERVPWPTRPTAPRPGQFPLLAHVEPETATYTDLSAAGRAQFQVAEERYDTLLKRYAAHRVRVTELSEWMRKTVHPDLKLTHMPASQSIDQWYDNLRELGGIAQRALKFKYKNEYELFITNSSNKKIKDLAKWTDDWLNKVTKAHNAGAEVTESFKLVTDLERALRTTHSGWTTAFRGKHSHEIAANTLRYQTIATELRQEATILGASRSGGGK